MKKGKILRELKLNCCVVTGRNNENQCNVSSWQDIIAVSASYGHTVGLKKDGTVVAIGSNTRQQRDVSSWTNLG